MTRTPQSVPTARSPRDTQELHKAHAAAAKFARTFQTLLRAARLYQKNHPHVMESLEAAENDLRSALERTSPLEFRLERGRVIMRGQPLADPRGELKKFADSIVRRGIVTMVFLPQTHLGELGTLAQLLGNAPLEMGGGDAPADWSGLLNEYGIGGIRINVPVDEKRADSVLTTLLAAVLSPELRAASGTAEPAAASSVAEPAHVEGFDELVGVLQVLERISMPLKQETRIEPQRVVATLRAAVAGADQRKMSVLAAAMGRCAPREGEGIETYFSRLGQTLALECATREFAGGNVPAQELRWVFLRLARELTSNNLRPQRSGGARWTDESYAEYLHQQFWIDLPAREKTETLRGSQAWCVPVESLRPYLEQLAEAGGERQARFIVLNYAGCLNSAEATTRLAVATGLSELIPLMAQLWPPQAAGPQELTRAVTRGLIAEGAPEVLVVLGGVLERLALLAQERSDYAELERILGALEDARATRGAGKENGRAASNSLLPTLTQRILENGRWQALVDASLEHRPLDAALARILARDPERLLERMNARLSAPRGLEALAPMARLLRAIGEPVIGALVTRLFDPRTHRATAAVKLLAVTRPERLLEALPRALPAWDWNIQDMAVGELIRLGAPGVAMAFLEALPHAHVLVVPMMLDEIGVAGEIAAVPLLLEIAEGRSERMKDVFVRIKAVEALGRLRAPEAAELLRNVLRQRNGLTHVEPAGLRAAAEEALALIENRPSSARVRTAHQAAARASISFTRPRRYMRVPLESPLAARISTVENAPVREAVGAFKGPAAAAKVTTLSLGGAFVESDSQLAVGESFDLEIRSGLRKINGTAVVRNLAPGGGGVEFVHMRQDDREKLRKLVSKLLKD